MAAKAKAKKEHSARSLKVRFNADKSLVRTETLKGQEYVVTPAVILVEGVLQPGNAGGFRELALATEFGKVPQSWNGRPVTISHPKIDGSFVSAGLTDVWESGAIVGMLFNTYAEDNKLKTEVWANKTWMEESGYTNTLQRLMDGDTMEVSTGLFADTSEESGIWNGERYDGVWYNIVPDHLALLPNETGACSVEDGCGTSRTNARLQTLQTLSAALKAVESENSHEGCCMSKNTTLNTERAPSVLSKLISFFSSFSADSNKEGNLMVNASGLSDSDARAALATAIDAKFGGYNYIIAVYSDRVVYETYNSDAGRYALLSRNYSIGEDNVITLSDDFLEVRPVTDFVPVSVMSSSDADVSEVATDEPATTEVTVSEESGDVEQNTEATENVDELAAGAGEVQSGAVATEESTANTAEVTAAEHTPAAPEVNARTSFNTLDDLLAAAPEHLRSLVQESVSIRDQERVSLIDSILGKDNNKFTREELSVFSTPQLQKVALLGDKPVDFSGKGGPLVQSREADSGNVVVPMPVFSRKAS